MKDGRKQTGETVLGLAVNSLWGRKEQRRVLNERKERGKLPSLQARSRSMETVGMSTRDAKVSVG